MAEEKRQRREYNCGELRQAGLQINVGKQKVRRQQKDPDEHWSLREDQAVRSKHAAEDHTPAHVDDGVGRNTPN